jgi:hypothetical protein
MYRPASVLLVVSSFLLALFAIGCNGGSSNQISSPPNVMTTSLPAALVGTSYSFTLGVSGGAKPYTWVVSSGSLPSWAQLDSTTGTIAGMPDADGTTNFSVTVTDSAGLSDEQDLSLVVNPASALAISTTSLPNGSVGIPYGVTLQATGGVTPYTWSISSGSLPIWANLSSGGNFGGTPNAKGTSNFTVKVSDSQATPASATQALSITVTDPDTTNNAELKGQYAFLLQGFDDGNGNQFATIGSFVADGNGKITGGLEDINGSDGYKPAVNFTGSYNVGADGRGMATFANSLGTSTTFAIAVGSPDSSSVATRGSMIMFDYDVFPGTAKRGSGFFYQQNASAFKLSSINGPYAFQFAGQTEQPGTRSALTGAYTADGKGNVTNGEATANANGETSEYNSFTATIGTDGQTASFGRVKISPSGIPLNFVCYIVSAGRVLAMSTDKESTAGLLAGETLAQASTSFSTASLNGKAVSYSVGLAAMFNNQDSMACAGLWTFTPNGSPAATYSFDCLYGWVASWEGVVAPSNYTSYTVAANGKVTMTSDSDTTENPILYLVDTNKGFFMTRDNSISTGFLEQQDAGPFSTSSVSGNYFLGTIPAAVRDSTVTSGTGTSAGDGTLNLTLDRSEATEQLTLNDSVSLTLTISANGRGEYQQSVFYIISPKKLIFLSDPNADAPTILILER